LEPEQGAHCFRLCGTDTGGGREGKMEILVELPR